MSKTCPSCGYSAIGPFTDNCPICAEPVRNVRSDTPGFGPLGSQPPWLRWVLGGVVVAVLSVGGCCGLGMWRVSMVLKDAEKAIEHAKADAEADRRARTVVVSAAELVQEFQNNPVAADRKYKGKYLEIAGVVDRTGTDGSGTPFVVLHAGDENAMLKIECFFRLTDEEDEVPIKRLGQGQTITVRGEYNGRVSNVQVRDGVLVK
jgi:hypothetical protein